MAGRYSLSPPWHQHVEHCLICGGWRGNTDVRRGGVGADQQSPRRRGGVADSETPATVRMRRESGPRRLRGDRRRRRAVKRLGQPRHWRPSVPRPFIGERIGCIDVLHGSRRAALRERGCRGFRDDEGGTVEQDRQAYIEKLKAQMDQWDAEIDKLEAKAREAQADQRIRYEEAVQDMHQRRDEAQKMLKRVQEASAASWKDLRTGFDAAWSDVSKAMDRAMARWR